MAIERLGVSRGRVGGAGAGAGVGVGTPPIKELIDETDETDRRSSPLKERASPTVDATDGGGGVSITTYDGACRPSKTSSTSHGCLALCDAAGFLAPSLCGVVGVCGVMGGGVSVSAAGAR